jgi:hypothetical protein
LFITSIYYLGIPCNYWYCFDKLLYHKSENLGLLWMKHCLEFLKI